MLKPYNLPAKKAVWRLLNGTITSDLLEDEAGDTPTVHSIAECIGSFRDKESHTLSYKLRYVKSLSPIVLADLSAYGGEEITIGGVSTVTSCELPEETHQEILERAVTLAKIAWQGATATQVARQQEDE